MAIWKDQQTAKKDPAPTLAEPHIRDTAQPELPSSFDRAKRSPAREPSESVIATELTIEGKIEGAGHIRIAGRFKGDAHVQGNLTIEPGAKLTGSVRASTVVIGGELEGNIEAASRVELLETGILNGDLKAGSLTVAAGSRMRGQVEFGWKEENATRPVKLESAAAS